MSKSWEERFWPKVNKTDDGCWLWIGAKDKRGRRFFKDGQCRSVVRYIWVKLKGPLTKSDYLHPSCKSPLCINPDHHYVGNKRNMNERPVLERFFEKVNKHGPIPPRNPELGPCWIWTGRITPFGYGAFFFEGRDQPAHRVSWILQNGPIESSELDVCHKCDIPDCVRPDHTFLGTAADNILDCHRKGRAVHPVGEAAGKSKLTTLQVYAILFLYDFNNPQPTRISRIFKVSPPTIQNIAHRRIWRHLKFPIDITELQG